MAYCRNRSFDMPINVLISLVIFPRFAQDLLRWFPTLCTELPSVLRAAAASPCTKAFWLCLPALGTELPSIHMAAAAGPAFWFLRLRLAALGTEFPSIPRTAGTSPCARLGALAPLPLLYIMGAAPILPLP